MRIHDLCTNKHRLLLEAAATAEEMRIHDLCTNKHRLLREAVATAEPPAASATTATAGGGEEEEECITSGNSRGMLTTRCRVSEKGGDTSGVGVGGAGGAAHPARPRPHERAGKRGSNDAQISHQ